MWVNRKVLVESQLRKFYSSGPSESTKIVQKVASTGATFQPNQSPAQSMTEPTRKFSSTPTSFHLKALPSIGSLEEFTGPIPARTQLKSPAWTTQLCDQFWSIMAWSTHEALLLILIKSEWSFEAFLNFADFSFFTAKSSGLIGTAPTQKLNGRTSMEVNVKLSSAHLKSNCQTLWLCQWHPLKSATLMLETRKLNVRRARTDVDIPASYQISSTSQASTHTQSNLESSLTSFRILSASPSLTINSFGPIGRRRRSNRLTTMVSVAPASKHRCLAATKCTEWRRLLTAAQFTSVPATSTTVTAHRTQFASSTLDRPQENRVNASHTLSAT